jgi:hypothetical protein
MRKRQAIFEVAASAKQLTPAQRRAVLRGCISDEARATISILANRLLFYREPTPNTHCYSFKLTEFGRLVQAQLRADAPAGEG